MVNKTQFYKTKVALAVVLSLGLAACGDSDGDEGSTSTTVSQTDSTQNTVENQDQLTVTVKGLVIDSNGNPVVGAAVWLGNTETMTSGGGQYEFTDINVTDVVGVNNEGDETDDNTGHQSLTITVLGTDSYLGAIVTVTPEAQVNNTGGTGDNTDSGANSDTTIQTFVSGYTVEAGTAVLPMLNAGAYGYIRDCRTGQPLADTSDILSLDFVTISEDADSTIGTQLTNSEDNHTIGTDADGMFSLTGLAANSSYTLSTKEGWAFSGLAATTSTDVDVDSTTTVVIDAGIVADSNVVTSTTTVTGNVTVGVVTTVDEVDATDTRTTTVVTTTTTITTTTPSISAVNTGSEDSSEFLSTIEVCPVDFVPVDLTVDPMIKSIDGQIGNTVVVDVNTYAALNQGVVNDFVIHFNEEMAATFDLSEARVQVDTGSGFATISDATVTLSADATSATVTFVTDLAEGSKVDVWFPHWTATDADEGVFLVDNSAIEWDDVGVTTLTKAVYSHAYFCTFNKPDDSASVTLGPQVIDADEDQDGNSADLATYSSAFQDNYDDNTTAITQLNDGDTTTGARLVALAAARAVTVTIDQAYAVVEFDGTNASSLVWTHGTLTVVPGTTAGYTIVGTGANTELHIGTPAVVAHNDVITVTPVNGFNDVISSGTMSVTLVDAIAPTTVLQNGYDITATIGDLTDGGGATDSVAPFPGEDVVSGTTANAAFGNGGEISAPGTTATAAGEPIIYVQPRLLAGQDERGEEFDTLVADMADRLTPAELAGFGSDAVALAAMSIYDTNGAAPGGLSSPIYDETAITGWAATDANIGVAFSEDVTLTTTAPAYDGTGSLVSNFAVSNDVIITADTGIATNVDLVTFETSDVVALSLDAGANLGFVGSVTDSRANVSTANAQVFIQDAFPPMMTAALWDGDTLTLTFNEAPEIPSPAANIIIIDPSNVTADEPIAVDDTNTTVTGNVMTITLTAAQNVAMDPLFVDGTSGEFLYDDTGDGDDNQHALIDWDVIEDATGNSWSDFNSTTSAVTQVGIEGVANANNRWEVTAPRFLAVNEVGPFNYQLATTNYLDTNANGNDEDGLVTYTITFSHPILLTGASAFGGALQAASTGTYDTDPETAGAVSVSTVDAEGFAIMNALITLELQDGIGATSFAIDGAVLSNVVANGSLTVSADHTVLTLSIVAFADTAAGISFGGANATTLGLATQTQSAITGDLQLATPNIPWQNVN